MTQRLLFGAAFIVAATGGAFAQSPGVTDRDLPGNGGAGVRTGNITSTGETVPNPGASQGAGTTSLDRGVQSKDDEIQGSICKGC